MRASYVYPVLSSLFLGIPLRCFFFFFNDTATTEIYTLSLHDALPISPVSRVPSCTSESNTAFAAAPGSRKRRAATNSRRSEEHTSELQSHLNLVCRLLLEKKKKKEKKDKSGR